VEKGKSLMKFYFVFNFPKQVEFQKTKTLFLFSPFPLLMAILKSKVY